MTNHFTFFESYYEAVKELDAEIKAEYFDVLFSYALHDECPLSTATPIVKALFLAIKPNLDKSKARREAGKQGGSKAKQSGSKAKQSGSKAKQSGSKAKQTPSDKEKEKEKDKDKEFTFTLVRKESFENLTDEYQARLQEYIKASKYSMPYSHFRNTCIANDYKYKNFSLAYSNWAKKDFNTGRPITKRSEVLI